MRGARTKLGDAEHEVEAAAAAHAKLKANLADLEDALLNASNRVTVAVDAVLRAGAEHLLAEAETASLRLRAVLPALQFMIHPEATAEMAGRPLPVPFATDWDRERHDRAIGKERADRRHYAGAACLRERNAPFEELRTAIQNFLARPPHTDGARLLPASAPLHQARAALMDDADHPLPSV
jgi:hypothetical protein